MNRSLKRRVRVGDHHLAYSDDGSAERETILCLHSLGTDRHSWDRVVPLLVDASYRVICPDAWGHGESVPSARVEPIDWVPDIAAVLEDAGVARAHVVGVSMGAAQALDFALRRPEMVEDLVIGGAFGSLDRESAAAKVSALVGGASEHGMVEWARLYVESTVISSDPVARAVVGDALSSTPLEAYSAMTRACFQPRAGDLASLDRSVLVVWGSEDAKTPRPLSEDLMAKLPNAHLTVVDGVGHLPHVDAPDVFATHVLDHIRGGGE